MDASDRIYSLKNQETKIIFNEHSLQTNHNDISEEFARYFSIDDDDIILLDQSQIIFDEVKILLDYLINKIHNQEHFQSQIYNYLNKHSLDLNNEEEFLHNKKVRFNNSNDEHQSLSTCLFIAETLPTTNPSTPYVQFLYNLGFDLCLEQNLNENNYLSENDKQTIIKHNEIFHQYSNYSCKYCSFQTNTIHVMDHHYRTPHTYNNGKYHCTYCSFRTFRLSELRRHLHKKHNYILISEPSQRRYQCTFCSYETDERNQLFKHNQRCQILQTRTCMANNLLAPSDQLNRNTDTSLKRIKPKPIVKTNQIQTITTTTTTNLQTNNHDIIEPILIESDHDSSSISRSSSDEDFIVSSDEENSSKTDNEDINNKTTETSKSRIKTTQQLTTKSIKSFPTAATNLPALTKLLLLNGSSTSYNTNKSSLIPIQPKPINGTDVYQLCHLCQCYVFTNDYVQHMNEKHNNLSTQSQQTISTPIIILNTPSVPTTNSNTSTTSIKPTLILSKGTSQPPPPPSSTTTTIFLLSTSTMNTQLISLNMIKCPWCDTNFEHIDIMTGHLMRYHRMTLAAAKVVVAEQMKIQGSSSNELSLMFKHEIEQIQKEFTDKFYWKISQPKVYLHQIDNLSCFVCHNNIDDMEKHFLSIHQIQLTTMNTIKQCCLCGFHCDFKNSSLFEHQLRTHSGVCYSSILKQFIRFEPPPTPLLKTNNQLALSSHKRILTTHTDKKFGCRKCGTSSGLYIFEELIEHLRSHHKLNVKLHRRCIICQQTYLKGKEYNQHCLEHLNDEYPSINLRRY